MNTKFQFEIETVSIANTAIHPILESTGYNNLPDEFIKNQFEYFDFYDKPVAIFENGKYLILTHAIDYNLLVEGGHTTVDVYVANFNDEFNIRRFIGFRHAMHTPDRVAQYENIKVLLEHKETEEGKEMFKAIPGVDFNEKIGSIMGASPSTIKRVREIGEKAPEYLPLITNSESTFRDAQNEIKKRKLEENAKKKSKLIVQNKKEVFADLISILKTLNLDVTDENAPFVVLNGKEFGSLNLETSIEIKGGSAFIRFADSSKQGLVLELRIKNFYEANTMSFDNQGNNIAQAA